MARPMAVEVVNRQKTRRLNLALLRSIIRWLATEWPAGSADNSGVLGGRLCVQLINAAAMADLNQKFLDHAGSTDVITFDYRERTAPDGWCGEIFLSVDDAVACGPKYGASWQVELTRYLVHGMLHLRGYDDTRLAARRKMKRAEGHLLKTLSRRFDLSKLDRLKDVT